MLPSPAGGTRQSVALVADPTEFLGAPSPAGGLKAKAGVETAAMITIAVNNLVIFESLCVWCLERFLCS